MHYCFASCAGTLCYPKSNPSSTRNPNSIDSQLQPIIVIIVIMFEGSLLCSVEFAFECYLVDWTYPPMLWIYQVSRRTWSCQIDHGRMDRLDSRGIFSRPDTRAIIIWRFHQWGSSKERTMGNKTFLQEVHLVAKWTLTHLMKLGMVITLILTM